MQTSLDSTSICYNIIQVHYLDDKKKSSNTVLQKQRSWSTALTRFQKVCISFKMENTAYFSFHNQMINTVPRKNHTQPQMLQKFKHHIHTLSLE